MTFSHKQSLANLNNSVIMRTGFTYLSHIYNEESKTNVYLKIAATREGGGALGPNKNPGRARAPPPSPQCGGGNQSCLTADIWFISECGNRIPARLKRST